MENNYTFIDGQNLYLGMKSLWRDLDFKKLFLYLKYKHNCQKVFYFIGYIKWNEHLYKYLEWCWFTIIFKETTIEYETLKGNVDAEMILQTMIEYPNYNKALLVTSDGDFACVVRYLQEQGKFLRLVTPATETCARILKKKVIWNLTALSRLKDTLQKMPHTT